MGNTAEILITAAKMMNLAARMPQMDAVQKIIMCAVQKDAVRLDSQCVAMGFVVLQVTQFVALPTTNVVVQHTLFVVMGIAAKPVPTAVEADDVVAMIQR